MRAGEDAEGTMPGGGELREGCELELVFSVYAHDVSRLAHTGTAESSFVWLAPVIQTHHECAPLLTLILGLVLHYGETPTRRHDADAIGLAARQARTISALRSSSAR